MLSYLEYLDVNKRQPSAKAAKMYLKYIDGEKEIMNGCAPTKCGFEFATLKWPAPCDMGCDQQEVALGNRQEGKTPMNTERDYLNRRLRDVNLDLTDGLRKQFLVDEYLGPRTYKELIAWVTGGQYTLDAKKTAYIDETVATESWFIDPMSGITWTGRGVEDRPNYNLASAARKKAYQAAQDIVNTGDAAAGLAALNEFAAFTYTVPEATPVAA